MVKGTHMLLISLLLASLCFSLSSENPRNPDRCAAIENPNERASCFMEIADTHAETYGDCDGLMFEYQLPCYSRITFEQSGTLEACEQLFPQYRQDCASYFVLRQFNGDFTKCDILSPDYREYCYQRVLEYADPTDTGQCEQYGGKYALTCEQYVVNRRNIHLQTQDFVYSAWAFLTSPTFVLSLSGFIILAAASLLAYAYFKTRR